MTSYNNKKDMINLTETKISTLYKLEDGETIRSVAKKFEISHQVLASVNKNIKIESGVTIVIPVFGGVLYKVQAGDTIDSICAKFNIQKWEFQEKNKVNFVYHGMIVAI